MGLNWEFSGEKVEKKNGGKKNIGDFWFIIVKKLKIFLEKLKKVGVNKMMVFWLNLLEKV